MLKIARVDPVQPSAASHWHSKTSDLAQAGKFWSPPHDDLDLKAVAPASIGHFFVRCVTRNSLP